MNPKSGKAGNAVDPAKPDAAEDADVADPGKVEEAKTAQVQEKTGKYGAAQPKPHKPPSQNEAESPGQSQEETKKKDSWIEIELLNEADEPVPGEAYEVTLPDGSVAKGTLDGNGFARVEGFEPGGPCKVTFPDLDKDAWELK